jgi:hypothetical protein
MTANRIARLAPIISYVLLHAMAASSQTTSAIAGVVKDSTGAVLPGVTVEATSPALIEKSRTVVTDGGGQYNIVDLRPGTYTVLFTLTGFTAVRREGIEISGGFTATINTDMPVGTVEETLTVSGQAPLVDARNVRQQRVIDQSVLDSLPMGQRTIQSYGNITPGFVVPPANRDVGGNQGETFFFMTIHGSHGSDSTWLQDGMRYTSSEVGGAGRGILINAGNTQEIVLTTANMSAEQELGGVTINVVPKEGGNLFKAYFVTNFTNNRLQSDNLTDAIRARGLTSANSVDKVYDLTGAVGGPVFKNRLWFYSAHRFWGNGERIAGARFNLTQGTPFFTPDPSRFAVREERNISDNLRFTYQASPRNKFNFYVDNQNDCQCRPFTATVAPEAAVAFRFKPAILNQVTWNSPLSNKVLVEAGVTYHVCHWDNFATPEVKPTDISILEASTSFRYNAATVTSGGVTGYGPHNCGQANERFAVSYITGAHALKTGVFMLQGWRNTTMEPNGDIDYVFLNGVPNSLTEWAAPLQYRERQPLDLGVYVQDQWTVNRLTLNLGLRFDYTDAYSAAQQVPADRYLPARDYPKVDHLGYFQDIEPRLGMSWNVTGSGKTAIKASVGRYVTGIAMDLARANSPVQTVVNSVTRTWNDTFFGPGDPRTGNYVPDCDLVNTALNGECGTVSNLAFGQPRPTTAYSDKALRGFGNRPYNWQASAEIQHEPKTGISLTAGWYRNWYGNFTATDNLLVAPADYTAYSITAPVDSRLPGGGGYTISGLFDVSLAKFGQVNNLVTGAAQYGKQTEVSNFFSGGFNARLREGVMIGGGVDTGRTVTDNCFVIDSPQQLTFTLAAIPVYCHVVNPFKATAQLKIYGSYSLPIGFLVSATFQNLPGIPIGANYPAPNALIATTLGRNLAACGTRIPCTATQTVPLVAPNTLFEDRMSQVDLRLAKTVSIQHARVQLMMDLYNALNASPILGVNSTFGPAWLRPTQILDGRLVKFGAQLTF